MLVLRDPHCHVGEGVHEVAKRLDLEVGLGQAVGVLIACWSSYRWQLRSPVPSSSREHPIIGAGLTHGENGTAFWTRDPTKIIHTFGDFIVNPAATRANQQLTSDVISDI